MSFSVQIRRNAATVYTFAAPTPFISGRRVTEHDTAEPPRITGIAVTWAVECVLYGKENTLPGLWAAFKAAVDNPASAPDGVRLIQGSGMGAVLVDSVAKEDGFYEWRIETVELDRAKNSKQWRSEVRFTIQVFGRKRFVSVLIGTITNLAKLTETKSWSYDGAGLPAITLSGELEVTDGSAVATARLLVPAQMPLPGTDWRYETNGPEGANVEQLDLADRKASFTSTMRQLGLAPPSGVGPGFSVTSTTSIVNGEQVTTTTVEAEGIGASDAVHKYRPSTVSSEVTSDNQFTRRSTGVFVEKEIPAAKNTHRYIVSGGGQTNLWHPRCRGRLPLKHVTPFGIVTIKEEFVGETYGDPSPDKFNVPESIADGVAVVQVGSGCSMSSPVLLERGSDRDSDKYSRTFGRTYDATSFAAASDAIFKALGEDWDARGVQNLPLLQAVEEPDQGQVTGG